jgi:hypothetical protein
VRAVRLLEWRADGGEVGALTTEQVARDVGNLGIEELVHPADVVNPT